MKKAIVSIVTIIGLVLLNTPAFAKDFIDVDLSFSLEAPDNDGQKSYLGLEDDGPFTLGQVKAGIVIIQIFSMYCPICQREAADVNAMVEYAATTPKFKDRIRFIGIGAGNSPFEVDFYRDKYDIKFPLFADGDFKIHKRLNEVRTPHFIGLVMTPGQNNGFKVFYSKSGEVDDPQQFLDRLIDISQVSFD